MTLEAYREKLKDVRVESVGKSGVFIDRSPTGSGKSTADFDALRKVDRSLLIVPAHTNEREVQGEALHSGIEITAFPQRLLEAQTYPCPTCRGNSACVICGGLGTVEELANCWNHDAIKAEKCGLSVTEAVCPSCPSAPRCRIGGYLAQMRQTIQARHVLSTHRRAAVQGLGSLSEGRAYVAIHEDALGTLRPTTSLELDKLDRALWMLARIPRDQLSGEREAFIGLMRDRLQRLYEDAQCRVESGNVAIPKDTAKVPVEEIILKMGDPAGIPWGSLMDYVTGDLYAAGVTVTQKVDGFGVDRRVVFVRENLPQPTATVWIADATARKDILDSIFSGRVEDHTPQMSLTPNRHLWQLPTDVTKRTQGSTFRRLLRGVLCKFPDRRRIGVITHRKSGEAAAQEIGEGLAQRIVRVSYFGSGQDRASNSWYRDCDLLIVLGTARVNLASVQQRLMQVGNFAALSRYPGWGAVEWSLSNDHGGQADVEGLGYSDPDWQAAHESLVTAGMVQAVGRARILLPDGIDVVVVSTENLRIPRARYLSITEVSDEAWDVYQAACAELSPIKDYIGPSSVTPQAIARRLGCTDRNVRKHFTETLIPAGLIRQAGVKGFYYVTQLHTPPKAFATA